MKAQTYWVMIGYKSSVWTGKAVSQVRQSKLHEILVQYVPARVWDPEGIREGIRIFLRSVLHVMHHPT